MLGKLKTKTTTITNNSNNIKSYSFLPQKQATTATNCRGLIYGKHGMMVLRSARVTARIIWKVNGFIQIQQWRTKVYRRLASPFWEFDFDWKSNQSGNTALRLFTKSQ
ncbi:unnamed protein product, partial [Ceratitis capitata]